MFELVKIAANGNFYDRIFPTESGFAELISTIEKRLASWQVDPQPLVT